MTNPMPSLSSPLRGLDFEDFQQLCDIVESGPKFKFPEECHGAGLDSPSRSIAIAAPSKDAKGKPTWKGKDRTAASYDDKMRPVMVPTKLKVEEVRDKSQAEEQHKRLAKQYKSYVVKEGSNTVVNPDDPLKKRLVDGVKSLVARKTSEKKEDKRDPDLPAQFAKLKIIV